MERSWSQGLKGVALVVALSGAALSPLFGSLQAEVFGQGCLKHGHIEVFGDPYRADDRRVLADQARIIVYRPETAVAAAKAASIFVNGDYHATLSAGGYSSLCVQPENLRLGVGAAGARERPGESSAGTFDLKRGQTIYLRVGQQANGDWGVQSVAEVQARNELVTTRLQIHTLSRVEAGEICRFVEATPPAVVPLAPQENLAAVPLPASARQRVVIRGGNLFKYARGDRGALTASGIAELNQVVHQLRTDYERIDSLVVIGYSDPLGKNQLPMSQQRAQTVRDYLIGHGVRAREVHAEGRGAAELIVSNCGTEPTPAVVACNDPNRRVVVEIGGLRHEARPGQPK